MVAKWPIQDETSRSRSEAACRFPGRGPLRVCGAASRGFSQLPGRPADGSFVTPVRTADVHKAAAGRGSGPAWWYIVVALVVVPSYALAPVWLRTPLAL